MYQNTRKSLPVNRTDSYRRACPTRKLSLCIENSNLCMYNRKRTLSVSSLQRLKRNSDTLTQIYRNFSSTSTLYSIYSDGQMATKKASYHYKNISRDNRNKKTLFAAKKKQKVNKKALATLTLTFVLFSSLFLPVFTLRLMIFQADVFKVVRKFHESIEIASFIAMMMTFFMHPLLNVAADKNLKTQIVKTFKILIMSKSDNNSHKNFNESQRRRKTANKN